MDIIRYSTVNWTWSNLHDAALIESLSDFYNEIPKEIMYLIKDHSFHHTEEYKITRSVIRSEKYYSKHNQLLHKKLCSNWYLSHTDLSTQSIPIGLYIYNNTYSQSIFDVLNTTALPSLQLHSKYRSSLNKYEQIMRTLYIDNCQIRLHLIAINNNNCNDDVIKYPAINMIILHENDSLTIANQTCKMLWNQRNSMKNCILVKIRDNTHNQLNNTNINSKLIDQLASRYNIPSIPICFNQQKTITDLFNFVVKYYWFCNVVE